MSGEWMNHCFSHWEKTAFSRAGALGGAVLMGLGGHTTFRGASKPVRAALTGASALSGAMFGGILPGEIQGGVKSLKDESARRADRTHHEPKIREARGRWEDQEQERLSQKLVGKSYEHSGLEQEDHHRLISDPAYSKGHDLHSKVQHLPRSEQLKYWRGLSGMKTAGQLIKAVASPVIGAGKMIGNRVAEKPISTIMGAKALHSLAVGTVGTVRAARGDIQNAQNQHGTPTQAQHMGARQPRPNPARISQTGSY
jgi:hypothetical protein